MTLRQRAWEITKQASLGVCLALAACGGTPEGPSLGTATSELVRLENRAMALGAGHTCVILSNGVLKCWGRNDAGQLGLGNTFHRGDDPGEMGGSTNRVNLGTGRTALAVAAGSAHTCALLNNNQIKCWGLNDWGQLGVGDQTNRTSPVQVILGSGRWARAIAAGHTFTCALLDNNQIKCWGINTHGNLGLGLPGAGTTLFRTSPSSSPSSGQVNFGSGRWVRSFALGSYHGCAILDNNRVKCWGAGYFGQVGRGNSDAQGDQTSDMGSALLYTDLGSGRTAKALDAGGHHTCAWLDDDSVKCWGWNDQGQLGQGDILTRGNGAGQMGDALPTVSLPTGIWGGISAGRGENGHTCIIGGLGEVRCWGQNWFGGLGDGSTEHVGDDEGETPEWGYTDLGFDSQGTWYNSVAIGTGASHSCAGLFDGNLKCWGLNDFGQLGLEHTDNIGDQFGETSDGIPIVNVGN